MFAHVVAQRSAACVKIQNYRAQTYLSLAVGMVIGATTMQAEAVVNTFNELPATGVLVEQDDDSSKVLYDKLKTSTISGASRKPVSNAFVAQQTTLFFECTQVQTDTARLACFDKVATQGETNIGNKQSLDLIKTLKSTITGNPQIILADDDAFADELVTTNSDALDTSSAANTSNQEALNTVGLTESEAQVLENIGVTQKDLSRYTPLSLAYDLDQNSERGTWTIRPYRPNYILPLFYSVDQNLSPTSSNPDEPGLELTSNQIRNTELKFQVSFKYKVSEDLFDTNADLWFGYTQQAHWQVYNEDNSRPFRATDYQPEVFLTQPVTAKLPFGGRLRMLGAGAMHHSNGRSDPISRSWNRAYLMGGAEWGKLSVIPRVWVRINNEDDSSEDNADIEDYMGHGDVTLLYDLPKQQSISSTLRFNTKTKKGAAQIDYIYPLTKNVNGYVQLFHGYGESLIDYDYENTAIGVGIVLNDWKGF